MGIDVLDNQITFTKGVLKLFSDNSSRSYTTNELADAQHLFGSIPQLKRSIELLVKQGLVKVKRRGSELCYQVVPAQKK